MELREGICRAGGMLLMLALLAGCQAPAGVTQAVGPAPCGNPSSATRAPAELFGRGNPLAPTPENLAAGEALYRRKAAPTPCVQCHGEQGRGDGVRAVHLLPQPTNFSCPEIQARPDGQLYWVIHEGANYLGDIVVQEGEKRPGRRPAGTSMRPHRYFLSEEQTWQLVLYIRHLAAQPAAQVPRGDSP